MTAEVKSRNRYLYKIEIGLLKILPMLIALIYFTNSILAQCEIDVPILSYIGGMSIIPIIFIYISSYVFKFCSYHRMFLHYIVLVDVINVYDYYVGIGLHYRGMISIHCIIAAITLFFVLYLHRKCKRNDKYNKESSSSTN
jgi:hypothetical protein